MIFAVLCTGPSMSQAVADSVRHLRVIAVNGTYELAPWADALVANDVNWWSRNPEAVKFAGRKFTTNRIRGTERLPTGGAIGPPTCSGVVALEVAKMLGAKRILLLGADFHGSHYFGDYKNGLRNTDAQRRRMHESQFKIWRRANPDMPVLNCTEGSKLGVFPLVPIAEALLG